MVKIDLAMFEIESMTVGRSSATALGVVLTKVDKFNHVGMIDVGSFHQ